MTKRTNISPFLLPPLVYERQAELCLALSHPVRLMVLDLLSQGEATASRLQKELSIPKSNLSQHLSVLKRAGIVQIRKEGLLQHLRLAMPQVKQACDLVRAVLLRQLSAEVELVKSIQARN